MVDFASDMMDDDRN